MVPDQNSYRLLSWMQVRRPATKITNLFFHFQMCIPHTSHIKVFAAVYCCTVLHFGWRAALTSVSAVLYYCSPNPRSVPTDSLQASQSDGNFIMLSTERAGQVHPAVSQFPLTSYYGQLPFYPDRSSLSLLLSDRIISHSALTNMLGNFLWCIRQLIYLLTDSSFLNYFCW
jgi:hypothetical protein